MHLLIEMTNLLPRSAQAILSISPDVYFMLSGTGQARNYPGMAWGNGFVTNQTAIQVQQPLHFPCVLNPRCKNKVNMGICHQPDRHPGAATLALPLCFEP